MYGIAIMNLGCSKVFFAHGIIVNNLNSSKKEEYLYERVV
jgi:hypothetical protein